MAALGEPKELPAKWISSGDSDKLTLHQFGKELFITIENLSRLSRSQLRWQPQSHQVCMSNPQGEMCFEWDRHAIRYNGKRIQKRMRFLFQNDDLYVPMNMVRTPEFGAFSSSDISWYPDRLLVNQNPQVNLRIPSVERYDGQYRLAIDVDPSKPPQLIKKDSDEIWIRFTRAVTSGSQVLQGDDVISEIRILQKRRSADMRIYLGRNAADSNVYFENGRKRLVIEVDTEKKEGDASVQRVKTMQEAVITKRAPKKEITERPDIPVIVPAPVRNEPVFTKKEFKRVFVIDPGHGGIDSGAVGARRGTLEKDINLSVAKVLAQKLEKIGDIRVILTRDKDVFVPLDQRTTIANEAGADLFISIHCNSALSSKANGFEAYFLSPDATDKAAEGVARMENSVVQLEAKKGVGTSKLNQLLASMAVYNFVNESSKFAAMVCRKVRDKSNVDKVAVKEADFYVLRGAQMPSVLIELEYLSNSVSESRLKSTRYQNQLVVGIIEGILAYDKLHRQEQGAYASQSQRNSARMQR